MAKTILLDESECIGCESCVEVCPDAFAMSDDGEHATVVDASFSGDCVEEAIETCPVACISIEE
ncbi:MAG: ferredoxin [Desulfovibrionales bacterium]|nr:ferredoxin [Desulfovibrionales bacterium]